ncbi:tRNA preQ1(34) S-adenosylmethionine ribosyltransferase-isomerase QueA [Thermospira aquatica]|uniref:S-adenosylmethionine:tRNA ribosyltransferase-isomerase n=1 Tax=Thermospira aquatica TaxID=2828656 RepID=A0AAX3BEL3_9SPIR|nr:tRNA preQ1(34) S-adenosylmethionine ribosyltransferase-isomerase QueA [Thermospira aquatica]URA10685.1 tRNA preQ1(34) S-adenosylmethionine ribosyltransferase-isomerase QueA [Thermospira aquatica]
MNIQPFLEDIAYELPEDRIASHPLPTREESRLLLVPPGERPFEDRIFSEILNYLVPGDCLVFNNSRVFKARLFLTRHDGKIFEILLVERLNETSWRAMVRNARRVKPHHRFRLEKWEASLQPDPEDPAYRIVHFSPSLDFEDLERLGEIPLPPYIVKKREKEGHYLLTSEDEKRYQSVLASLYGSVAAPTASFHFSEALLEKLREKGIVITALTLHVGPGTFRTISPADTEFQIHKEWITIPEETIDVLKETRKKGKRIIAVGTTSTRALETMAQHFPEDWQPYSGYTDLFIYGDFPFRVIDGLITNFHMPYSTLLLLVQSFGGKERVKAAYKHALEKGYRFLSYGDAMFLWRKDGVTS